jgi:hypothetical protein
LPPQPVYIPNLCQESGARSQEHATGKTREDLRSNWRSADLAVAEKLQNTANAVCSK